MPVKYELSLQPSEETDIPDGDGYHLADSILSQTAAEIQSLSVSMLFDGPFSHGEKPHTKRVFSDEKYRLRISASDPRDEAALTGILSPYLNGEPLTVSGSRLSVVSHSVTQTTHDSLRRAASEFARDETDTEVHFTFNTPTCITTPGGGVTEMFPHSRAVFSALRRSWNYTTPSDSPDINTEHADFSRSVFEKPESDTYRTYSILTDKVNTDNGDSKPFFRQGFVGDCGYGFKNADEDTVRDVLTLALYAEYGFVGVDTHHGCGCVDVSIKPQGGS